MKSIPLSQGKIALVDDEDFERVSAFKWSATCNPNGRSGYGTRKWYACRMAKLGTRRVKQYLHRFLMDEPAGLVVDHLDGDGLNNTRANLMICTQRMNSQASRRLSRTEEPWL